MNLKTLRRVKLLTQTELASRAEIHRSMIGRYEAGVSAPSAPVLLKLARALGTTVDALLADEPDTA